VAQHGREHGLKPDTLTVAGDSVGGNMTAAVTLVAKERSKPFHPAEVVVLSGNGHFF
jgi:acetyl esterase/lipase